MRSHSESARARGRSFPSLRRSFPQESSVHLARAGRCGPDRHTKVKKKKSPGEKKKNLSIVCYWQNFVKVRSAHTFLLSQFPFFFFFIFFLARLPQRSPPLVSNNTSASFYTLPSLYSSLFFFSLHALLPNDPPLVSPCSTPPFPPVVARSSHEFPAR